MPEQIDQQFVDSFTQAERLCNNNQLAESLVIYEGLLKQHPDHISVLNNMGLVCEKSGDYRKAAEFYHRCNSLMPDQPVLINNLANAYTRLDRWSDARPLLEKVVTSGFDAERNAEKYALCLFTIGTKLETKEFIESVITTYTENPLLNRLLGKSLLHLNYHMQGLGYIQKGSGLIEFDTDGVKYLN